MEEDFTSDTTVTVTGTIYDLSGSTPVGFKPTTVTMTLFDLDRAEEGIAGAIVNSRLNSDITSSVSAGGVLTLNLTRADMAMLDSTKQSERRGLQIAWVYNGGADRGERQFTFTVKRNKVPTS